MNDPRVTAYVTNELSGEERKAFEAELAENTALREEVRETASLCAALTDALFDEAQPALTAEQREAIAHPPKAKRRERGPQTVHYLLIVGVTALLISLAGRGMRDNIGKTVDNVFRGVNAKIKQMQQAGLQ